MKEERVIVILLGVVVAISGFIYIRVWDTSVKIAGMEQALIFSNTKTGELQTKLNDHEQRISTLERKRQGF